MEIRGVAHPAPSLSGRGNSADLSAAEIGLTSLAGRPLLNEHDRSKRVGTCLASWESKNGDLRIAATVDNVSMQNQIKNGTMRGLSLGTDVISNTNNEVLYRGQAELSVCEEGRRHGTWIDTVRFASNHHVQREDQDNRILTDKRQESPSNTSSEQRYFLPV